MENDNSLFSINLIAKRINFVLGTTEQKHILCVVSFRMQRINSIYRFVTLNLVHICFVSFANLK